jgi:endo-1,4-beta-mannosidase
MRNDLIGQLKVNQSFMSCQKIEEEVAKLIEIKKYNQVIELLKEEKENILQIILKLPFKVPKENLFDFYLLKSELYGLLGSQKEEVFK